MRVMVLVKATEASENETASAEWIGAGLGDDRYMGAASALLGTHQRDRLMPVEESLCHFFGT